MPIGSLASSRCSHHVLIIFRWTWWTQTSPQPSRIAGGNPNRLRPHIKTAKLLSVVRRFVESGILQCKCATTLELAVACEAGMRDVLVAYPMVGANAQRVQELSARYPSCRRYRCSSIIQHSFREWESSIGIFIDVNPGMDRTGIEPGTC